MSTNALLDHFHSKYLHPVRGSAEETWALAQRGYQWWIAGCSNSFILLHKLVESLLRMSSKVIGSYSERLPLKQGRSTGGRAAFNPFDFLNRHAFPVNDHYEEVDFPFYEAESRILLQKRFFTYLVVLSPADYRNLAFPVRPIWPFNNSLLFRIR